MRNLAKKERLEKALNATNASAEILQLDVTDFDSINRAIKIIVDKYGTIDAIVNNAGFTIDGFFEDHSEKDIEKIFRTNVFGALNVTRKVLPIMREQKSGNIIMIGSIAGQYALPQISVYSSTKFALEGLSEALRYEVKPFGINVSIIEPCFVDTDIAINRSVGAFSNSPESAYSLSNQTFDDFYENYDKKFGKKPEEVAELVHKALISKKPKLRYMMGKKERRIHFFKRLLPQNLYEKVYNSQFPKIKIKRS